MKKFLALVVVALCVSSAVYALGLLDGDASERVDGKEFAEFTFSGYMRNGLFDGPGAIDFHEGERFDGNFVQGRFDGEGTFYGAPEDWNFFGVFHVGRIGGGELHMDSGETVTLDRSGPSDILDAYSWRYHGGLSERGQHGEGIFVFSDGSIYTGGFSHGLADGNGTLMDADGRVIYSGGFAEGKFDGFGTYFSIANWTYEGNFRSGMFDGEGFLTIEAETIRGVWESGVQIARYE